MATASCAALASRLVPPSNHVLLKCNLSPASSGQRHFSVQNVGSTDFLMLGQAGSLSSTPTAPPGHAGAMVLPRTQRPTGTGECATPEGPDERDQDERHLSIHRVVPAEGYGRGQDHGGVGSGEPRAGGERAARQVWRARGVRQRGGSGKRRFWDGRPVS